MLLNTEIIMGGTAYILHNLLITNKIRSISKNHFSAVCIYKPYNTISMIPHHIQVNLELVHETLEQSNLVCLIDRLDDEEFVCQVLETYLANSNNPSHCSTIDWIYSCYNTKQGRFSALINL